MGTSISHRDGSWWQLIKRVAGMALVAAIAGYLFALAVNHPLPFG